MEISLVYDLRQFFKLTAKRNSLKNLFDTTEIKHRKEELKREINDVEKEIFAFIIEFKKAPYKYFTGKGFLTFRNYQYARLFQNIYNKAFSKIENIYLNQRAAKNIKQLKSLVFKSLIKPDKNQKISKNTTSTTHNNTNPLSDPDISSKKEGYSTKTQDLNNQPIIKEKTDGYLKKITNKITNMFLYKNINDVDTEKGKKMISYFGQKFKLKRGIEVKSINFDYSQKNPVTNFQMMLYILLFIVFLPALAYYFNYKHFEYFVESATGESSGLLHWIIENFFTLLTVILDEVTFIFIDLFFNKSRFFKSATMYKYIIYFSCFYILLSNVVYPNFAMKRVFNINADKLNLEEQKKLLKALIKSLYATYWLILASGFNSKILNPYIINKYIFKNEKERDENTSIVISLSFLIGCVLNVAFYGTITPFIFIIFCAFILGMLFIDYFTSKKENNTNRYKKPVFKSVKLKMNDMFDAGQIIDKKDLMHDRRDKLSSEEILSLNPSEYKTNKKLPITIFVNAVLILIMGIYILSILGYYGIAKSFDQLLDRNENQENILAIEAVNNSKNNITGFHSFTDININSLLFVTKNIISYVCCLIFNTGKKIISTLFADSFLILYSIIYICIMTCFIIYYNNERFLNRLQNEIWAKQKVTDKVEFKGPSYREINPAYKLLESDI